jgi:hypothetical protein
VQGSNCGGSTYPAGTCSSATFFDDDSSDGRTPGFELCVDYNAFACYFDSIFDHLKKNLADSNSSVCDSHSSNSDCSFVECMNQHNNPTFMKAPVGLEIEIYFDGGDLINDIVGDCGGTVSTICGCALGAGSLNDEPRRSVDNVFLMNGQNSCSWLELMRHELGHTYGYRHVSGQQDYSNNRDDLKHCVKASHRVH